MLKSKAIAILGALVLACMPAFAATISSDDEVLIRLVGVREGDPLHYTVEAGQVVLFSAHANHGDLMYIFAVALDRWGEPDYGNILTLFLGYPRGGSFLQFFEIPKGLEGMTFQIMAVTQDSKGEFHSSNQMTIAVAGAQILVAAPLPRARLSQAVALPADED